MGELGTNGYRFSIAWPRIQPSGKGRPSPKGLAFYDRLIDECLEHGVQPMATLYHWDLPQALQDDGGWANRATIDAFVAYTDAVTRRLGDRVKTWITINEPWVVAAIGNLWGEHAPGLRDPSIAAQVGHNVLVAHGQAVPVIRANSPGAEVGITLNFTPSYPSSDSLNDRIA